jgi:raffinose/stachyose/melibiose transport system substrate-binding protein
VQPVVLYHNKELFEQVGVEVPETWDDLLAAVDAFKAEGITPFALAGQSVWPELMWIQYLTDRIGGPEVFQAVVDGKADAWSDPAITEALERIQQLVDAGAFGQNFGSVTADANADVALVYTGKAAMLLQGGWVYGAFKADAPEFVSDGTLGFSGFPAIESGKGDAANIVGNPANFWSVSSNADDSAKETATTYLNEELYSDEYVDQLLEAGGVPPVVGIEDKLAETDDPEFFEFVYSMVEEAPHFQLSWDQALPPAQAQELLTNLSQIFLGETTPQEFVDNMNATL